MDQPTFSDLEYLGKKRKTRREQFLERMDDLIPWQSLEERIRPFYPRPETDGGPIRWLPCCESTASNSSTTSATPAWRICSTSPILYAGSWG